jgi:hypothetical protein
MIVATLVGDLVIGFDQSAGVRFSDGRCALEMASQGYTTVFKSVLVAVDASPLWQLVCSYFGVEQTRSSVRIPTPEDCKSD